jgi:nucleoside-diphosphate-sugar epimerase
MILVTGGTGLVGAHLLLYLIESENGVEKIRAIYETIKNKSLFELYKKSFLTL